MIGDWRSRSLLYYYIVELVELQSVKCSAVFARRTCRQIVDVRVSLCVTRFVYSADPHLRVSCLL